MSPIKQLLSLLATRVGAIGAAAASAALLSYFRAQFADGIKWLFQPIMQRLPWRTPASVYLPPQSVTSELTLAEVFLITPNGKTAIYAKTGSYVVATEPLNSYYEGVTASEKASRFSTQLGAITETTIEHGFYISRIDLGSVLEIGTRFRNVYRVQLDDCFSRQEEHWTQEIAVPTKHLTLRVHFPSERPPVLVRCKRVFGLTERQIKTAARITRLFDQAAIVWEIQRPKLGDIYKLEWRW